jgi:hypothetical protein
VQTQEQIDGAKNEDGSVQINTSSEVIKKPVGDLIFDTDSGEMLTKEEYHKRQDAKKMEDINEYGEEEDDDDEDDDDEGDDEEESKEETT